MVAGILNWVKSLFRKTGSRWDVYHPGERLIYSYWDGEKVVRADPQVLWSKVMEKAPDISVDSKVARSLSRDAPKAYRSLISHIRSIFVIKSFVDGGLTEGETEYLLGHFMEFCEEIKKNTSPSPTSPGETLVISEPSSPESPVTPSSSASGSTENGQTTDEQEPLPSESASVAGG